MSDIFELFCTAYELGTHFLVLTRPNRLASDGEHTVADEMSEVRVKGLRRMEFHDSKGRPQEALREIRYRMPLGVIDAWMWAREFRDANGQRGGIEKSIRWIEGYERIAEQAVLLPQTRLVYVTDRECDIAALMARANGPGQPADWPIRSQ